MTLRPFRFSALLAPALTVLGSTLLISPSIAQKPLAAATPESPYGGVTVEDIVARVNDQIISRSDYDRAVNEVDAEARKRGETMQQISDGHKDLLRNLIDQQLWISKGKELGVTGETELVKQLDEIRKKYNLETIEDLEKAAREQGVSYEDFKANIRNQIITQQVMRDEVGRRVTITPGEAQRYYEAHKQEYAQPESVHLAEIMVATGADDDASKLATAKAKADDIEAKLKSGGNFDQIARSSSDGQTAAQGGDLGKFGPGGLAKVFEDATFSLKPGQFTEPIRTKQGYVIFKVTDHTAGGIPAFKDVESEVEENFYMSRMEPAVRAYLTTMREEAYIDIKPGYVDSGASAHQVKPIDSAYAPPAPKKKKKVQRTRFRETERGFHKKPEPATTAATAPAPDSSKAKVKTASASTTMKAGKKEKIRYGQAPRETLPNAAETKTEDAGALPKVADNAAAEQDNPLEAPAAPEKKTRFSERAKLPKEAKPKGPQLDSFTPLAPDSTEVADRQTQSQPLGLSGDTSKSKKKAPVTTDGKKKRITERPKQTTEKQPVEATPAAPVPGAPAPMKAPTEPKTTPVTSTPGTDATQQTPTSPDPPQSNIPASEPPH
jgi:peptidyl-prolyl cis-trans isomerase SurA